MGACLSAELLMTMVEWQGKNFLFATLTPPTSNSRCIQQWMQQGGGWWGAHIAASSLCPTAFHNYQTAVYWITKPLNGTYCLFILVNIYHAQTQPVADNQCIHPITQPHWWQWWCRVVTDWVWSRWRWGCFDRWCWAVRWLIVLLADVERSEEVGQQPQDMDDC